MFPFFTIETRYGILCAVVKTQDKNSTLWLDILYEHVVAAATSSTIAHISSISCVPSEMVPWRC